MIEVVPAQPNSRRGYPVYGPGGVEILDDAQFEGHVFLPGYTLDIDHMAAPMPIRQFEGGDALHRNLGFHVLNLDGGWQMRGEFMHYQGQISLLLGACLSAPQSSRVNAFEHNVSQDMSGVHLKAGGWHFDYPFEVGAGWNAQATNIYTTEFALEPHGYQGRNSIYVSAVDPKSIWRPEPGEVVIIDDLTAHRRPRTYRSKTGRVIVSLDPQYTRTGKPRKPDASVLNRVEYDDYSNVLVSSMEFDTPTDTC